MLYRSLAVAVATVATVHGWNDCSFPDVGYFALDEGVGISYAYANAAMGGKLYSGGYTKGNFAFVGVTDGPDVNPVPSATLWGDTTSDIQNLYVAEVSAAGSMTMGWHFKGDAIQEGEVGHGRQTNGIDPSSGLKAMLDKKHLAVKGGFKQILTLPNGTVWDSNKRSDGTMRLNKNDQVRFLMKLDTTHTKGTGSGTSGWARMMDENIDGSTLHAGGVSLSSADGDTNGDMIVAYTGYAGYNATMVESRNRFGGVSTRPVGMILPTSYLAKLSKTDGSEVWKHEVPHALTQCRVITDGSFFCGYTMSSMDGPLDFGSGVTMAALNGTNLPLVSRTTDEKYGAGIIKFNSAGEAQWAKQLHAADFRQLAVSADGALLATYGSAGSGPNLVSRIDTSAGNEGNVLWTDGDAGGGTHGYRGIEVTDDRSEVITFGQHSSTMTLTDTTGSKTTLAARGSYEVFVAAYDAADGSGKWAVDGGGTGMEYFFAMSSDPETHEIYIGGTSRSEYITWGDVKRKNVMYNEYSLNRSPKSQSLSPVGSSKAFNVKIKSTTSMPSCLISCNEDVDSGSGPAVSLEVKAGHCYIDRHCYANGEAAPYPGHHCQKCDSAVDQTEWSAPDTTSHCYIGGKCQSEGDLGSVLVRGRAQVDKCSSCQPSVSTSSYSPVAGCNLDVDAFSAGCYDESGSQTSSQETGTVKVVFV